MKKRPAGSNSELDYQISFRTYGLNIRIFAGKKIYIEKIAGELNEVFPDKVEYTAEESAADYNFYITSKPDGKFELHRGADKLLANMTEDVFFEEVKSQIRVTAAEFAVSKVFLHAGVVEWRGKAIVIPGESYAGKTTLVAELVKRGALYFSDEFAVIDADGNVQPFPKMLSLRGIVDDDRQVDYPVEALGGTAGSKTIPAGMVLITEYRAGTSLPGKLKPEILSAGQGMMEILKHTLPLRINPEFTLRVLNKITRRAIIVRIIRGEAKEFAEKLLNYFDTQDD